MDIISTLATELSLKQEQVEKTVALIDDGNTIPFIARYRKEVTGSLDDTILRRLDERLSYLRNLEERKGEVRTAIENQGKLTEEIVEALERATILTEVEDIYRPFKQKRKTRASVAKERGLEPLAELILAQEDAYAPTIEEQAQAFVDSEKGVEDAAAALAGACDIIAEQISDNAEYRKELRALVLEHGQLVSKKADEKNQAKTVYEGYYDFHESLKTVPSHRVLAINRGEKEEILRASVVIEDEILLNFLYSQVITKHSSPACKFVSRALVDSYERLLFPAIEREIRSHLFDVACEGAIANFSLNLKHLLMQPPIKGKTALGFDPGQRTGCKLAVVDKTGKVLDTAVIYPHKPASRTEEAKRIMKRLINTHHVDMIAIGNGTASKESEIFVCELLREVPGVKYMMVSEAGASVYSASEAGAAEFPDFDATQRSAVSIARRLQDPLAELVKIDPKSIGVGQYQHDMKPAQLDAALTGVVEDCVNSVGVDLNTASYSLLSYISGINLTSAKNIVKYREENGEFTSRAAVKKVPRIGDRAYQQCAGFLRVPGSREILDNTGVHPESYEAAKALLSMFDYTAKDVQSGLPLLRKQAEQKGIAKLAETLGIGQPTLLDIIGELEKPGRDLRDDFPQPVLRDDVLDMADLKPDMILTGTVRNVIDFGAFVDIGVHQDGLVHVSQISTRFIKHPSEEVAVGDIVKVKVLSVDLERKRISLTMKGVN